MLLLALLHHIKDNHHNDDHIINVTTMLMMINHVLLLIGMIRLISVRRAHTTDGSVSHILVNNGHIHVLSSLAPIHQSS